MPRPPQGLHVVFGATGGLGAAVLRRLAAEGEPARAVARDPARARDLAPAEVEIVRGDALDPASTTDACRGAAVVHHCASVPYHRQAELMPAMTANVLAGARSAGARLVFPGNVYGYGPLRRIPATEEHPLDAATRKGRLRNVLERTLWDAHERGEVPVVIPRFPDFYGPNVWNTPGQLVFARVTAGKRARWPGRLDVLHDLVFIDDAAAAAVLLGSAEAAAGRVWHVPGAGPLTGRELVELACAAAGEPARAQALGAFLLRLAGVFDPNPRELVELLYEWEEPLVLDGSRLAQAFPSVAYTPHEEAVRRTVQWFRAGGLSRRE